MAGAHFAHFDPFYRHLGKVLAGDAAALASFDACAADGERVRWLDAYLEAAGVVLRPLRDAAKDQQLAAQMLDAARIVAKLRADFERESEDEETSLGYQSKELYLLGGAIRNGNVGMEVVQNALLNRAALLASLGHFDEAMKDCQGVKTENEDINRQCQVAAIKSACMAKSNRVEAEATLKRALTALSKSQRLEQAQKAEWTMRLVQQMKNLTEISTKRPRCRTQFAEAECPPLLMGAHPTIPHVSSAVELRVTEQKGRCLVANTTVDAGSVLIVDEPYAWMLSPSSWHDHCTHCCKPVMASIPCPNCSQVCFCSEECLSEATSSYHSFECGLLHHLVSSEELSGMSLLVMRVVVRARRWLRDPDATGDAAFAAVHRQVGKSEARPLGDLLKRTATALFLGRGLRAAAGFEAAGHELEAALLQHLQSCSCNAYEISEHVDSASSQSGPGEVSAIGGAVYASISLANHACWPNVCRVSYGRRCVVRTTRRLHPGEELLDNYGYSFLGVAGRERRLALRKQYFFECQCVACVDEWPLFAQLASDTKFRCAACARVTLRPLCKNCGAGSKGAAKTIERELRLASDRCQVAIAKLKAETVDDSVELWLKEFIHERQDRVALPNKELFTAQQALIKTWGLLANRNQVLAVTDD